MKPAGLYHLALAFLLSLWLLILLPSPVLAQLRSCRTVTENQFPGDSDFNSDPANLDCSVSPVCDPQSPREPFDAKATDWLNHAQVYCADNAAMLYKNFGPESWWSLISSGPIKAKTAVSNKFIPNTGLSPHFFLEYFKDIAPHFRRSIDDKVRSDPAAFNAMCAFYGYYNVDECAEALKLNLNTSSSTATTNFPNLMAVGSTLERLLPTQELLLMYRQQCDEVIIPCAQGSAGESTICSHVSWIDKQTNVLDTCYDLPTQAEINDPKPSPKYDNKTAIAWYLDQPPAVKTLFNAIPFVSSLRPAYLVLAANPTLEKVEGQPCSYYDKENQMTYNDICPIVVEFYIPGIQAALRAGSASELKLMLMPEDSKTTLAAIHDKFFQPYRSGGQTLCEPRMVKEPVTLGNEFQCIADKINQFTPCQKCNGIPRQNAQFAGAAHEPKGDKGISALFAFIGKLAAGVEEKLDGNRLQHYSAWYVMPSDLAELDAQKDAHPNAPIHAFLPLDVVTYTMPDKATAHKLPINISSESTGGNSFPWPAPTTEPDNQVGTRGTGSGGRSYVDGGHSTSVQIKLNALKSYFGRDPCPECERIQQACYHAEILRMTQNTAGGDAIAGVSGVVGGDAFADACPPVTDPILAPYIIGGIIPSTNNQACTTPGKPSDPQVQTAANGHGIPASWLLGIYTIEAAPFYAGTIPFDCITEDSHNAKGVMQIQSETYQGVSCGDTYDNDSDQGVCSSDGQKLSRCNLSDAFTLAARVLKSKVGVDYCDPKSPLSGAALYEATCNYYGSCAADELTKEFGTNPDGSPFNYCDAVCSYAGDSNCWSYHQSKCSNSNI